MLFIFQKNKKRLHKSESIRGQFKSALEYYENVIQNYEETYFNNPEKIDFNEMSKLAY